MAKKKRTSLKPVARPFATTSIAKKVEEALVEEPIAEASVDHPPEPDKDAGLNKDAQPQAGEYDADRAEVESLQILVDQQQAKAEREALRSIKVCIYARLYKNIPSSLHLLRVQSLEQESRASKLLPRVEIDSQIRDRILETLKAVETSPKRTCRCSLSNLPSDLVSNSHTGT
jgi:ATP-dependent RNA helicase DHX29